MSFVWGGKTAPSLRMIVALLLICSAFSPIFMSRLLPASAAMRERRTFARVVSLGSDDCMDLWTYKMQSRDKRRAEQLRDANDDLASMHAEAEFNCELITNAGSRAHAHSLCNLPLLARKGCRVLSISSSDDRSFESAMRHHADCDVHTLEPLYDAGSRSRVGWQLSSVVKQEGARVVGASAAPRLTPLRQLRGNLTEVVMGADAARGRLDVLHVDCRDCDAVAFEAVSAAVTSGLSFVAQMQMDVAGASEPLFNVFLDDMRRRGYMLFQRGERPRGNSALRLALVHEDEARNMYRSMMCGNSGVRSWNHVF